MVAAKPIHGYVEGGTLSAAEFTFRRCDARSISRKAFHVDLSIRAYRSYKGDIESGIRGSITMKHPTKEIASNPITFVDRRI